MTAVVGGLGAALRQPQELIAQIYEGRGLAPAAQLELEQAAVKGQRLLDVADLEGDMVETDGARFFWLRHGALPQSGQSSCGDMTGISQYGPPPCRCGPRGARSRETGLRANAASPPQERGRIICRHVPSVTSPPLRLVCFQPTPAHKAHPRPRYCASPAPPTTAAKARCAGRSSATTRRPGACASSSIRRARRRT